MTTGKDEQDSKQVDHFFLRSTKENGQRVAIIESGNEFSYDEISQRSATISHHLADLTIGSNDLVGLCLDRSPELIFSVLGTLRAGAAYVPIDTEYPKERIEHMVAAAKPKVVITQKTHEHLFAGSDAKLLFIEDIDLNAELEFTDIEGIAEDLCYVLFTSGSTGKPKGVAMPHGPLVNLINWQTRTSVLGDGARTLQFAPISFDVSFQDMFATFAAGGTLVLISEEDRLNSTQLLQRIIDNKVDRVILPYVALQYLAEAVERTGNVPSSLKEVFTSGEQLRITPAITNLFNALDDCRFCNQYGPTEGHVVSEYELKGDPKDWPSLPPIGKAIDNVDLHVLDEQMKPVKDGEDGELYLGGACVAQGYLNQPELTAERFIADPFSDGRLYKTGDLVARDNNGDLIYKGRIDGQVKVRGYRIELGEIEVAMDAFESIEQSVATVREDKPGVKRLVGYYTVEADKEVRVSALRAHLASSIPDYMIPSAFMQVDELPRTPSGKIDRRGLPAPEMKRPELDTAFTAPQSKTQKDIAQVWAALLGIDRVGIDDNFFDLGGNSLLSIQCVAELEHEHGLKLPIVKLYQHPNVRQIASFLDADGTEQDPQEFAKSRKTKNGKHHDVAIVGMAGRFPGAENVQELWSLLEEGRESISKFSKEDLDPSIPEEVRNDPDYVPHRGVINGADKFDADFFGINPRVAALMDPQQRVFLELAWSALEDAAYDPDAYEGLIGVYVGMGNNTYYTRNVLGHRDLIDQVGEFQTMVSNEKDYIATRLAFEFNLRGPALSIHTACSTSLTAIAEAYHSLQSGQSDMAMAGGIAITVPINSGHVYQEGGMYSPDGHCRPFDADANGTMFSDGAGIVVLKRLDDALRDGDQVHAVIKGAALNNDGSDKASFTAPSVRGQAEVIAMAQAEAGVEADSISYVETHGTATPLGDPIEVEALALAFGNGSTQHCAIGSIKSNIGHLTAAAGVAGLMKTTLALREGSIPATLHFNTPNPAIDLENGPFYVAGKKLAWERNKIPRRAGVSSFGVGGTNAHVILEEAPIIEPSSDSKRKQHALFLSAKTADALNDRTQDLKKFLQEKANVPLADIAYTLQLGRKHFKHRRAIVGSSHEGIVAAIEKKDPTLIATRELHQSSSSVVFMFPGQGSQYVNMGRDLYESEPAYKEHFDACCELFKKEAKLDLQAFMFADTADEEATAEKLKQTEFTQPALFAIQYSLAKLWMHWGIQPSAVIGHSIGEFAAACISGVFSLEDAVKLVAKRGSMMQALPGGSMLSIRAAEEDVIPQLPEGCSLAANNGPALCVASGPTIKIEALQATLEKQDIACKFLHTSHAFHSPMMDPIVEPYHELAASVELNAPRIPIVSTVTADWLKEAEATDPGYWSGHLRATVRFAQAAKKAWEETDHVMLEVGPRTTAATLARKQSADPKTQVAISSLSDKAGDANENNALLRAVAQLWQSDVLIDLNVFYDGERRRRVQLPTYPFQRKRFWVDPVAMVAAGGSAATTSTTAETETAVAQTGSPRENLIVEIKQLLEDSSGIELADVSSESTFLEMGLDSLFLTQVATTLSKKFKTKVTFRQLNEDLSNLDLLADHLEQHAPDIGSVSALTSDEKGKVVPSVSDAEAPDLKKTTFGAQAKIQREPGDELTQVQRDFILDLTARYNKKTAKSKVSVQADRSHMADPRVVTGFKPLIKELIYPLVVDRSKEQFIWDIDGNKYIDILNGFGSSLFGVLPPFLKKAYTEQLEKGIEIGPQHPLAGEVCKLLVELNGHDRAAVCNTGSEAVLGSMRVARTVTGRSLIVAFSGAYHGINDEVIIRGSKSLRSFPAAPGIMPEAVNNMLILDYGTPEALEIIRERADELAAVLVEPVQSRRPEFRPVDFLREVREITKASGTALIFDEVITGYRMHNGGAQALFGIQADMGTYGKVIGGGMPIGAITGSREYMDALDGGNWQFGDDSIPEVGVTYFAGTFVRHPLTMAAAKASLLKLKEEGGKLQERLNDLTDRLADEVNRIFITEKVPYWLVNFGSLWKIKYDDSVPYIELFFILMREKGIHMWDGFPCFITTSHTEEDLRKVVEAVGESIAELKAAGFLPEKTHILEKQNHSLNGHATKAEERVVLANEPPMKNARLGRTPQGDPAWFIPDPEREGKFMMLVETTK